MIAHEQSVTYLGCPSDQQVIEPTHSEASQTSVSAVDGLATAFELSGNRFGQMHSLRQLVLTDAELEAESEDAIPCGINVSIGFQSTACCARHGQVTACDRHDNLYHIAVAIDPTGLLRA